MERVAPNRARQVSTHPVRDVKSVYRRMMEEIPRGIKGSSFSLRDNFSQRFSS